MGRRGGHRFQRPRHARLLRDRLVDLPDEPGRQPSEPDHGHRHARGQANRGGVQPVMKRSTLLLTALTVLFAGHFARVLLPSIIWYLQEVLLVSIGQSALIWYAPFILALAVPLLARSLQPRGTICAGGTRNP